MAVGIMVGGVVVTLISLWRRRRRATALARCLNLDDYQTAARKVLSTALYEYLASGTDCTRTVQHGNDTFSGRE